MATAVFYDTASFILQTHRLQIELYAKCITVNKRENDGDEGLMKCILCCLMGSITSLISRPVYCLFYIFKHFP